VRSNTPAQLLDIKRRSVVGAVSYFSRSLLLQAIGIVSIIVLSIFFEPEDFGIYGLVTQVIGILVFFSDIGLAAALIQKKDEPSIKDYRTTFTVQLLLSLVIFLACLVVIALGLLSQKTGPVGNWILLALAISFPLATLKTIPSIQLERHLDFSKLIVPQIVEQITFHLILITLAIKGWGAAAYVPAVLVRSVSGVIVLSILKPWKIGLALDKQSLKSLLNFGVKFQINDFLARIKDQLFFLVLGIVLPLREFGYVQWAKTWSIYPYNLTVNSVLAITFPTFSRLQGHPEKLQRAIEKSLFFISLVIFPILLGMSLFIKPLLALIPTYAKWQPATLSFILFSLSIGWSAISTPLTNTLNAIGEINKTLKLMVMWTALTWVLTPVLIYFYGFNGVALAALLISFTSIFSVKYVREILPVRVWEHTWRQALAALMMAVIGVLGMKYWQQNVWWLILGMATVGAGYIVTMLLFGFDILKREVLSLLSVRREK